LSISVWVRGVVDLPIASAARLLLLLLRGADCLSVRGWAKLKYILAALLR
jgi:hypothetical protein